MDRVVHRRPGFTVAVAQCSDKILNFEAVNNENQRGWYTGYGMTYLYNADTGHYQNDFWPTVDARRLAGTTVDTRIDGVASAQPGKAPVGGVSVGANGLTGMRLSVYDDALTGKKAWFMFGDVILCAGTHIACTSPHSVETIIENRNIGPAGAGDNVALFNSMTTQRLTGKGVQETFTAPKWLHLADVGGYVILAGNPPLKGIREERSGSWYDINKRPSSPTDPRTRTYVTLWLDHGVTPDAQSYAYVMLPNATAAETASYSASPSITPMENSPRLQYAKGVFPTSTVWGAIFWNDAACSHDIISANTTACVFVRMTDSAIEVAVSDPTKAGAKIITVTITINNSGIQSQDPNITVTRTATAVTVTFNPAGTLGQSKHFVLNP